MSYKETSVFGYRRTDSFDSELYDGEQYSTESDIDENDGPTEREAMVYQETKSVSLPSDACHLIKICDWCEGKIEKSIRRITIWHQEASRGLSSDPDCDSKRQIFLYTPNTHDKFFSLAQLSFLNVEFLIM